jgi:hypothetical protein
MTRTEVECRFRGLSSGRLRGGFRATQPLVLPRLSATAALCTSAGRVQKLRGHLGAGAVPGGLVLVKADCRLEPLQ